MLINPSKIDIGKSISFGKLNNEEIEWIVLDRQDNRPKPDPYAFSVAMKDYNVKEENIMMVGDNEVDMMCAKNAHVKCTLVSYNEWFETTKIKTNPDYVIDNMTELIDILKKENGGK